MVGANNSAFTMTDLRDMPWKDYEFIVTTIRNAIPKKSEDQDG